MSTVIWWIRRDLRLNDNQALQSALSVGKSVIPVFILDPGLIRKSGEHRLSFLLDGLRNLDLELNRRGSRLILRQGLPQEALAQLMAETGTEQVFAEEDYSPYARQRDEKVASQLSLELVTGATILPPAAVAKPDGSPYKVFTPFSLKWKEMPFPGKPNFEIPPLFPPGPTVNSLPIPPSSTVHAFPAGEAEGLRRLESFTNGPIFHYKEGRNLLDQPGTAQISPYLRFGMLSCRRAAWSGLEAGRRAPNFEAKAGCDTWMNELIWREFYMNILFHFPNVLREAFHPKLRKIAWRSDPAGLRSWQQGLTGIPVVDACMRQLLELGWMHNRGRMIAASFLVKDLLINWQEGETWFMQQLVDGDPAANNGGWQWTAGVGTDAAPYFRILNPVSQSKKCDPKGRFIRQWLPEMANVPLAYIHEPWLMPSDVQAAAGCRIGKDYPAPIVNHLFAKERVLKTYKEQS
jgi:deoxyribodipyrimidine photo-lyase